MARRSKVICDSCGRTESTDEGPAGSEASELWGRQPGHPNAALDQIKGLAFIDRLRTDGYYHRQRIHPGYPRKVTAFPPKLAPEERQQRRRSKRARKLARAANGNRIKNALAQHGITTRPKRVPKRVDDVFPKTYTPEQLTTRRARNIHKRAKALAAGTRRGHLPDLEWARRIVQANRDAWAAREEQKRAATHQQTTTQLHLDQTAADAALAPEVPLNTPAVPAAPATQATCSGRWFPYDERALNDCRRELRTLGLID
jgi:hypothetical protein